MSTKIYNGFIFRKKSYQKVINDLLVAKDAYLKSDKFREEISSMMKSLEVNAEDFDKSSSGEWYRFISNNKTLQNDCGISRKGAYIYFDEVSRRYYGYYIGDVSYKFLEKFTRDFHYQNQSDQPEDISEASWNFREEVWERLLPGIGRLQDRGAFFQFYDPESYGEFGLMGMCNKLANNFRKSLTKVPGDVTLEAP
jgi:hypothetical protein